MPAEDLFTLDLAAQQWRQIPVDECCPQQRFGHRICASDAGRLWMLGGVDELGSACSSLYAADLRPGTALRCASCAFPKGGDSKVRGGFWIHPSGRQWSVEQALGSDVPTEASLLPLPAGVHL